MPLTNEEFDADVMDIASPIRRFLERNWDSAYTSSEVRDMLAGAWGRSVYYEEVVMALERLVAERKVASKVISGVRWYNIAQRETRRRIGFRQEG